MLLHIHITRMLNKYVVLINTTCMTVLNRIIYFLYWTKSSYCVLRVYSRGHTFNSLNLDLSHDTCAWSCELLAEEGFDLMWSTCTNKYFLCGLFLLTNPIMVQAEAENKSICWEYDKEIIKDSPCICQTFRGAISLVLSTKCFLNSFNCSFNSGYRVLDKEQGVKQRITESMHCC